MRAAASFCIAGIAAAKGASSDGVREVVSLRLHQLAGECLRAMTTSDLAGLLRRSGRRMLLDARCFP